MLLTGTLLAGYVPICYMGVKWRGYGTRNMGLTYESDCACAEGMAKKTAASRIFDTARDLFYRRGIRAVGVDEIVCGAGVTKPSLYRAYRSKDELVAACLREDAAAGLAGITAALEAAGPTPYDRLWAVVQHKVEKMRGADFRGCLISNVAVELPEPDHPGRLVVESCKSEFRALLCGLSRDLGIAKPEKLADGLILAIEGAMATHHLYGSHGPAQALEDTCAALIASHMATAAATN